LTSLLWQGPIALFNNTEWKKVMEFTRKALNAEILGIFFNENAC